MQAHTRCDGIAGRTSGRAPVFEPADAQRTRAVTGGSTCCPVRALHFGRHGEPAAAVLDQPASRKKRCDGGALRPGGEGVQRVVATAQQQLVLRSGEGGYGGHGGTSADATGRPPACGVESGLPNTDPARGQTKNETNWTCADHPAHRFVTLACDVQRHRFQRDRARVIHDCSAPQQCERERRPARRDSGGNCLPAGMLECAGSRDLKNSCGPSIKWSVTCTHTAWAALHILSRLGLVLRMSDAPPAWCARFGKGHWPLLVPVMRTQFLPRDLTRKSVFQRDAVPGRERLKSIRPRPDTATVGVAENARDFGMTAARQIEHPAICGDWFHEGSLTLLDFYV